MSNSVRPHKWQPTSLSHLWDSPGKNTGVGCHFLLHAWKWKVKVKSLSCVWLFATPWTVAYQAPLSKGCSRQECWSELTFPAPLITASIHYFSNQKKQYRKCVGWKSTRNILGPFRKYSNTYFWECNKTSTKLEEKTANWL